MTHRPSMTRRGFGATAVAGLVGLGWRPALAQAPAPEDPWPILVQQIFGNKPVTDGSGIVVLDAPDRALDAAVVPVTMRAAGAKTGTQTLRGLTLVIDQNPSPLVAKIALGAESGIDAISTRVRVNDYTNVHLVGELGDGTLHAVRHFVKAAGGCSAPTVKEEASNIPLGTMRLRQFPSAAGDALREAQLIIRHPNNSGLQMDQLTHLYIPAHYITSVKVFQGDALLFAAETGISVSQNPEFRFSFRPNGARQLRAEATDNKGGHFSGQWTAASA